MNVDLSIIIVNYNTYGLIVDCIHSIIKETHQINYEIIIVDNASKERAIEEIVKLDPRIRLYNSKENIGFGRANNLGMLNAKGDYFLLLNSDTLIVENAIDRSIVFLSDHPDYSVLGINQTDEYNTSIVNETSYIKSFTIWNYLKESPLLSLLSGKSKKAIITKGLDPFKVNQLSGAFMLLKKEVFETTKGFDPDFFMYYEETEWCQRIRKKYKIAYHPYLSFIHLHGKSAAREVMTKQMHLSAGLFWYKKGKLAYIAFLLVSYFIYFPTWFAIAFLSTRRKAHFKKYISIYMKLISYFIKDIPKSKNGYGERVKCLILKELL